MKTSSLEILERSALPPEQAQAILKVLESEMTASQEHLATRADMLELKAELRGEIQTLREGMAGLATKAELYALESRFTRLLLNCFFGGVGLLAGAVYFLYLHPGR